MKHLFIALALVLMLTAGFAAAQDLPEATVEVTPITIQITTFEPRAIVAGSTRIMTVFGANFTDKTTVRLVTMGLAKTTFVNSTTLTVELADTLPAGTYPVEVSDPINGTVSAAATLAVVAPTATPGPTAEPQVIPTQAIPTAVPGKPMLLTRNFSTSAASIAPGNAVTLTFEVINQGNQAAQGVSVALASGSKFLPANGQSSATLPDIFPNAVATVSLTVNAGLDATNGPNIVPLTLTYRAPDGEVITTTVNLSVNVVAQNTVAQVMVSRYRYVPEVVRADDQLTVTLLITNTGRETARGVIAKLGKDGILLPGPNGDSVPVGDLAPNESRAVDLPLIVKQDAKAGMQSQPLSLTYWSGSATEAVEVSAAITLNVTAKDVQAPLILLKNYTVKSDGESPEFLTPGQRFTLDFTIENLGNVALTNVLVAFGSVETSPGTSSGDGSNNNGSGTGTNTTIQPSVTFAPLGSGGTLFIDSLVAGGHVDLTQEFIVNGTTKSGIYALPISLNYRDTQGAAAQTALSASLVVVALPRLQFLLPSPLPEVAYTGEPLPLAVTVKNVSGAIVRLTEYEVTIDQGMIMEGAQGILSNVPIDDETTINAMIVPDTEGDVNMTLTIRYVDDLNQVREMQETYTVHIEAAPIIEEPPIEETPPPETPVAPEPPSFGRVLLALLGLGS